MKSTFPKVSSSNAGNCVTKKAVILAQLRSQVWEDQEWNWNSKKTLQKLQHELQCGERDKRVGFTYQIPASLRSSGIMIKNYFPGEKKYLMDLCELKASKSQSSKPTSCWAHKISRNQVINISSLCPI